MIAGPRRQLLTGLAVGIATTGIGASGPAVTTFHSDTYLIALCPEFVELEQLSNQMFEQFPDDNEREDGRAPIRDRQDQLAGMIEGLKPTSVAGFAAIAGAAAAWAPDVAQVEQSETHMVLISALLRGLIRGAA